MKAVYDIIWSDIINDDTSIVLFNYVGDRLAGTGHRFDDRISDFDTFEVLAMHYYPNFNRLDLFLNYPEEVQDD